MTTRQETSKLVELRTKTDRQLLELIGRTLEAALVFAQDGQYCRAERACEEVRRLLPWISRSDRRHFESRLAEIADMHHPHAHAACF
jgi:hypothetical protein